MTRADKIRLGIATVLMLGSFVLGVWVWLHPNPQTEAQLHR